MFNENKVKELNEVLIRKLLYNFKLLAHKLKSQYKTV